jgi:excisionase family DNA binding protein
MGKETSPTRRKLVDVEEARKGWFPASVSGQRLYKLAREGVIPSVRMGRLIYFSPDALDKFIEQGGSGYGGASRRAEG